MGLRSTKKSLKATKENNMFCKNCGQPLKEGSRFCHTCGTPIITIAPEEFLPTLPRNEYNTIKLCAIGSFVLSFIALHYLVMIVALISGIASLYFYFTRFKKHTIPHYPWYLFLAISGVGLSVFWLLYMFIL